MQLKYLQIERGQRIRFCNISIWQVWNKLVVQSQIKSTYSLNQKQTWIFVKHFLVVAQTYYIEIEMYLKKVLLFCLCSNPPSPLPPDVAPRQPQTESASTNSVDKYHTHHISEPTRQESLTSLKNDLENHLEDFEMVSCFFYIKKIPKRKKRREREFPIFSSKI